MINGFKFEFAARPSSSLMTEKQLIKIEAQFIYLKIVQEKNYINRRKNYAIYYNKGYIGCKVRQKYKNVNIEDNAILEKHYIVTY